MTTHLPDKIKNPFLLFLISFLLLIPDSVYSQKKQLVPSNKVEKIAFIDHSRVRKEYKEFNTAKDKLAKDNEAKRKSFEQSLKILEQHTKEQLNIDSLSGGRAREQIISEAASKRLVIVNNFQSEQKIRNDEKVSLSRHYEQKIITAIESIIIEKGITDVKSLVKQSAETRRMDITDLILEQLN